jgi:3-oxoacyl-[acyl-carrier protein] reductase
MLSHLRRNAMTEAVALTLVTGATRGIGRAIADHLSSLGHRVVGLSSRPSQDFPYELFLADLADELTTASAIQRIRAVGPVHHLVNNAGISLLADILTLEFSDMRRLFEVNVRAPSQLVKAFLPDMIAAGYGRIVNIGSKAQQGRQGVSAYAATKAAMQAMTVSWALECATKGVTVNLVAPGAIQTEMMDQNNPVGGERRRRLTAMIPAGELGLPAQIASAVAYFLSPAAAYTTGQTLNVCGGWSLPR